MTASPHLPAAASGTWAALLRSQFRFLPSQNLLRVPFGPGDRALPSGMREAKAGTGKGPGHTHTRGANPCRAMDPQKPFGVCVCLPKNTSPSALPPPPSSPLLSLEPLARTHPLAFK